MSKKIDYTKEQEGRAWYMQAQELMDKDQKAFEKHLQQAGELYLGEYNLLALVRKLMDDGDSMDLAKLEVQGVDRVEMVSEAPRVYTIQIKGDKFTPMKLSDVLPFMNDGIPTKDRQGMCHEKSFEIAKHLANDTRLVTGLISVLADKFTLLHSWVESDEAGVVFDYTMDCAMSIQVYKELTHAQPPLIEVSSADIESGKVKYNDWVRQVHELYFNKP